MSTEPLRTRIRSLLEPTIERMGYELVAVEWLPSGRPMLRLSIDGPQGVGVGDMVRVNHRVSLLLDEADPIPSAYTLEVSSPGIDRPVQRESDFIRFAGKRAKLVLQEGLPRRRYSGVLQGLDAGEVVIDVDGTVFRIPFEQIERAHLVLDLKEYAALSPKASLAALADGEAPPGEAEEEAPEPSKTTDLIEAPPKGRHGARRVGPRDGGNRPPRRGTRRPSDPDS